MGTTHRSGVSLRRRAANEFKEYWILVAYLYVTFGALTLFKAGVLQAHGVDWSPWGVAIVKAMLVAKFMLIARATHAGERFAAKPLIWQTAYKSLVFLAIVLLLTVIEEAVLGEIHGRTVWQSVSEIGGGNLIEFLATLILVFLIFFPYFAFHSLGEVMDEGLLRRLFLVERRRVKIAE
jgi:hypothetical protein